MTSTDYYDNGGKCFGCHAPIDVKTARFLAHAVEGEPDEARPFCDACAELPWPMHEVPKPYFGPAYSPSAEIGCLFRKPLDSGSRTV